MAEVRFAAVAKRFGTLEVLREINLDIADGEFVIFVGPSGSGKSTLLRVLAGLEAVSAGRVLIGGADVTHASPKQRNISMVFQNYALYPHMTVEKNITFGMRIRRESKKEQTAALQRVVAMLKLEGLLERKPRQLSGGQRQRVAMARAIVHVPEVFLMDEPLSNLDAKLRNEVRLSIMDLQRQLGCTMVYVTHDQIEAMTMADRVVVLNQGTIQQVGTPQELYHHPGNQFTAGFIGTPAMNFIPLARYNGSFHLPDGTGLPIPASFNGSLFAAEQVVLGIRPEHLSPDPREAAHPTGDQPTEHSQQVSLRTLISSYEMLGSEFLVHAEISEATLKFKQKNDGSMPGKGAAAFLHFSMARAHLFDGRTGLRIN